MIARAPVSDLPVVVIGAGPVGLAAAARLHEEGIPFHILEAGPAAGAAVDAWRHVRLFTPWRYLVDEAARVLLEEAGWVEPDPDEVPTGGELLDRYLLPLAAVPAIASRLRLSTRVRAVTRSGVDKLKSAGRASLPFTVYAVGPDARPVTVAARAVIDASGTYHAPNPLGSNGVAAEGETALARHLFYGIPDVQGRDRGRFEGKRVGVVGSGHSAFNTLLDLQRLHDEAHVEVTWFVRSAPSERLWGGEDADALSERGALGRRMRALAESGRMSIRWGFATAAVREQDGGVVLESYGGEVSDVLDEVVVVTGFRPDLSALRELRLDLDPVVEAPSALAPLIDPNVHSCGTVPPHGYRELSHPEPDLYMVGMKSYGRAPTFLLVTGYEQVRSVVKAIAGDLEAAGRVELVLPETGVCSTDLAGVGATAAAAAGCCGGPAAGAGQVAASGDVAATDGSAGCCGSAEPPAPAERVGISARRGSTTPV